MFARRPEPVQQRLEASREEVTPSLAHPHGSSRHYFESSNFASRRADAEAANTETSQRALVSMGNSDVTRMNVRSKRFEVIPVELFYDKDHPRRRYVRVIGDTQVQPLQEETGNEDTVETFSGPLRRPDSSAFPPAIPESDPRHLGTVPNGRLARPESSAFS